ncbi:MAG: S24 family peptidase [Desulfovibrionaceae bacterium]
MGFYDDFVSGLEGMIGKGKPFANPKQLADACGVSPIQVCRYLKRERKAYIQALAKILDALGARLVFPHKEPAPVARDPFFPVPHALAHPSADGSGLEANPAAPYIAFDRAWLEQKGDPHAMRLLPALGDALLPRIENNDLLLVDTSQTTLYVGQVYAVRLDDDVVVRRIAKQPGKILLVSDNPLTEPRTIPLDLDDPALDWQPLGRVVFVTRDLR